MESIYADLKTNIIFCHVASQPALFFRYAVSSQPWSGWIYFILLFGKWHKKKFHPSKLNRLNCSSCDSFILGWPTQVFVAFHSAWALWFDRNYMKSPWYEQAKSPATRNKHTSLMSPVLYRWLNQFFRLWILSEFTLTAYYFRNFALTSLVLSAADERSRQTEGGWEAANILKLGEKRSFHCETCRRINLPSSKCPVFNLLLSLLLILTSFSFFLFSLIHESTQVTSALHSNDPHVLSGKH